MFKQIIKNFIKLLTLISLT